MHYVVDPGPLPDTDPQLTITNDLIGSITVPLIRPATTGFARNVTGYQPPENDQQYASGDARRIVTERTIDVIVNAATRAEAHAQLDWLATILTGSQGFTLTHDGITWTCAGGRGVTSWQPIGDGRALRVTISYLPQHQHGNLIVDGTPVLGPL